MESREVFVSPRHGELWSADVLAVSDAQAVAVAVVVLAARSPPVEATLSVGRRWAGRGWHSMIECPSCRCVSRVLHVLRGQLLCGRCGPHLTVRQREHKNRFWTEFDGALEAGLLRSALRGRRYQEICASAEQLLELDAGRVDAALASGGELIEACDAVIGGRIGAEATQATAGWGRQAVVAEATWGASPTRSMSREDESDGT